MTDTAKLVEVLRAFHENATAAPWYRLDQPWLPSGCETSIMSESPDPHVARWICDFDFPMMDESDRLSECADADADLIIAMRNALPDILEALTQSEARRKADVAEALTPSGETKYAYSGEFKFTEVVGFDEDGSEIIQEITVPWTTIKEIMAAIAIRAAQQETEHG